LLPLAPLLLRLIPDQAILWIVLLGIALLISTAFLVYVLIARRKKRVFTKEKSEAEKRSRDEKGNSAIPDSKGK
jgi:phosphotransferase system  glucose/maltose/N-acetylglucosamine-specific IIC component